MERVQKTDRTRKDIDQLPAVVHLSTTPATIRGLGWQGTIQRIASHLPIRQPEPRGRDGQCPGTPQQPLLHSVHFRPSDSEPDYVFRQRRKAAYTERERLLRIKTVWVVIAAIRRISQASEATCVHVVM